MNPVKLQPKQKLLPKPTAEIPGLDEITGGGLPEESPALICGNERCGKTIMSTNPKSLKPNK